MGMPDVDEVEILGAETAILHHFQNVIGKNQARNIAYVALAGARGAKFNSERTVRQQSKAARAHGSAR